jgi:general secretion pathway protein A
VGPAFELARVPYHGLWTMPFRENTDPSFLWLGPPYREAFATLRAAVLQNAGLLLLSGEVGTGKTMLASALADSLRAEGVRVAKLIHPDLTANEFRHGVSDAFALPAGSNVRHLFLARFGEFLQGAYARGEKVLLVIDEAQGFGTVLLDEIADLIHAGREAGRGKVNVMNVLLVSQADVDAHEIAVRSHLGALEPEQVAEYVAFRLRVAGADRELFSPEAIRAIAAVSGGVPRVINRVCNCALEIAAERNESVVSVDVVNEVPSALGFSATEGHAAGVEARPRARVTIRRIAYAAATVVVIAVGVSVYQGGRAARVGADVPPNVRASGVTVPTLGASERRPAATRPPEIAPAAAAREDVAAPAVTSAPPVSVSPEPREERARVTKPPVAEVRAERPTPAPVRRPAPAPVARVMTAPDPVAEPPARGDDSHDPSAIINWILERRSAPEK